MDQDELQKAKDLKECLEYCLAQATTSKAQILSEVTNEGLESIAYEASQYERLNVLLQDLDEALQDYVE